MIRPVAPDDVPAIVRIYNHYILGSTATFETEPLDLVSMACRIATTSVCYPYIIYVDPDGRLLGYAYAHRWKDRAAYASTWETSVYVAPEACGRGIGRKLMLRLVKLCREAGAKALIACITAENTASCALHERLGFRKVSHFVGVGEKLGRRLDVVDYELLLK